MILNMPSRLTNRRLLLANDFWRSHAARMIRMLISLFAVAGLLCGCITTRPDQTTDLAPVLHGYSNKFDRVLATPETFRLQVLIAEVVTNRLGHPALHRSGYRVDAEYFYPASSIKLCAAVAALQTVEQLQTQYSTPDLMDVPLEIAPLFPGDPPQTNDVSNLQGGQITVAQEIRKLTLVSGNEAFNRLYDLVGHEDLNRRMHALGLPSVVLNHRLSETRTIPDMRASAAVTFRVPNGEPIVVPARTSTLLLTNKSKSLLLGAGYLKDAQLVDTPMDFSGRNGISLGDLQNLLVKVARPEIDLGTPALDLNGSHRKRLLQAMTEYPRESSNPRYAATNYPDDYSKFLLPGIRRVFPSQTPGERVEITAKIGRAYGFTVENSYLRNPKNGRAVFVTAVLYTNSDGILNDDKYDYKTVADPFFADLGELIARQWLSEVTQ
jgi:hypothetical protein